MTVSLHGRRAALTAAVVVLPLVGACASLIGLEDADVDDSASAGTANSGTVSSGTLASGTESSGTESSGTSNPSTSTGDGGGDVGVGSTGSDSSSSGSGGAAPPGVVVPLPAVDGMLLAVDSINDRSVFVLGMRGEGDAQCFAGEGGEGLAVIASFAPGGCHPVGSIRGDGMRVHSMKVALEDGERVPSIGGSYGPTGIFVDGAEEPAFPPEGRGGAFGLTLFERPVGKHIPVGNDGKSELVRAVFAVPLIAGAPALGIGLENVATPETCDSVEADDLRGVLAIAPGGACGLQWRPNATIFDFTDGAGLGLSLLHVGGDLLVSRPVQGSDPIDTRLGAFAPENPEEIDHRAYSVRFIPLSGDASYYVVSGVGDASGCLDEGEEPSPFVAAVPGTDDFCAGAFRYPGHARVLAGLGVGSEILVAVDGTHVGVLNFDPEGGGFDEFHQPSPFCSGCEITDMAVSGGEVWILARSQGGGDIDGVDFPAGTFLYHRPYEFFFAQN